jgi:hypothetical protein
LGVLVCALGTLLATPGARRAHVPGFAGAFLVKGFKIWVALVNVRIGAVIVAPIKSGVYTVAAGGSRFRRTFSCAAIIALRLPEKFLVFTWLTVGTLSIRATLAVGLGVLSGRANGEN